MYTRQLESEDIPVAQIYADGILAVTDQMPLILPEHWRISKSLSHVFLPQPNSIVSRELVRLPGIPRDARASYGTAWEAPIRDHLERSGDAQRAGAAID
jgi:hypothetical protein